MDSSYLQSLNPAQLKAVQHSPDIPLQILAGPGSGKTKVLTSRIAHLILFHRLPPSVICAVTFTNKAANEMKERLVKLIGKERTSEVRMGTFHALCALFLRRHAKSIGIEENFTICDAEESKKIIAPLLKQYQADLDAKDITLKEGTVMSIISKAKAKGLSSDAFLKETRSRIGVNSNADAVNSSASDIDRIVAEIYQEYEKVLRKNNSLDFDDLLLFGLKLFSNNHHAVKWCQHLLVDEFQDTNITQYELMRAIAYARRVTVVGDPDQSIYGWRSAEVSNLSKMRKDFSPTEQILLEQNYRSTASILNASMAIVAEDKTRIQKSLYTSHPAGTLPVLRSFTSELTEAAFIASEIKRLVAHMGGVLNWGDFVVLLRFNALSRTIESALQKEGIPSRILGGHKFFERMEIKDLLAYLQLVDNPQYTPALLRAINTPARGIGEKTITELLARANRSKVSPLELVEKIQDGKTPDIKPPIKRKLSSFITSMHILRKLAAEGAPPSTLIHKLIELIGYLDHLKKTQPDWDTRWENVQELITFASDVQTDVANAGDDDSLSSEDEASNDRRNTPLRLFLQASMLSSEGDNQTQGNDQEKVTISTCHAAKGLEWPVVMVPAVEAGTFPFYRTEDTEEERRLLYVACTRAQSMLYLSHATQRKVAGVTKPRELSVFVSAVMKRNSSLFTEQLAAFSPAERNVVSHVLDRPDAPEDEVIRRVAEYNKAARHRTFEVDPMNISPGWQWPANLSVGPPSEYEAPIVIPSVKAQLPSTFQKAVTFSGPSHPAVPVARPASNPGIKPASLHPPLRPAQDHASMSTPRTIISPPPPLPAPKPAIKSISLRTPILAIQNHSLVSTPPIKPSPPPPRPAVHSTPMPARPTEITVRPDASEAVPVTGVKRRLGMGRASTGYTNKKFKLPT